MIKEYLVRQTKVDAQKWSEHRFWEAADELADFAFPWENEPVSHMTFRALYDGNWLYGRFDVDDHDIKIYVDTNAKSEVIHGDRIEIFFRRNESLDPYYCIEIDPLGRIYDYVASFYRKFDVEWSWPTHQLDVVAAQEPNGYFVCFRISLESLNELGLIRSNVMQVGLFRGKCLEANLVDERMKWISWMRPDSSFPDFHLPSSFGLFRLV